MLVKSFKRGANMENQTNQTNLSKEKYHTQHYGAHSNCHAGLSDYNDGEQSHKPEEYEEFDGKEAQGNENESDNEDHGKYHSGL